MYFQSFKPRRLVTAVATAVIGDLSYSEKVDYGKTAGNGWGQNGQEFLDWTARPVAECILRFL